MNKISLSILFVLFFWGENLLAQKTYSEKADSILNLMNLDEKLGQLNLPSAGDITTGQAQS